MDKIIVLNCNRTHILVDANNKIPNFENTLGGKKIGEYITNNITYQIFLIQDNPVNYKWIPINEFYEFDLPFVVYKNIDNTKPRIPIKYLKSISNILLIIIIIFFIIYLINYIEKNYNIHIDKK